MKILFQTTALIAVLLFSACTATSNNTTTKETLKASKETTVSDADKEKAVIATLDQLKASMDQEDFEAFRAAMTEDVTVYGTAPEESPFDTEKVMADMEAVFESQEVSYQYSISNRDVHLLADGKSALAIEQGIANSLAKNIQFRTVYHFIEQDGKWLIDLYSIAMIPENKDLRILDAALD